MLPGKQLSVSSILYKLRQISIRLFFVFEFRFLQLDLNSANYLPKMIGSANRLNYLDNIEIRICPTYLEKTIYRRFIVIRYLQTIYRPMLLVPKCKDDNGIQIEVDRMLASQSFLLFPHIRNRLKNYRDIIILKNIYTKKCWGKTKKSFRLYGRRVYHCHHSEYS